MALWTAFLLGLAGSLHCAGMCGPLVLALSKMRPRTLRESIGRVCYHLGRVVSYCVMGLALGWLGNILALAGYQRWLSVGLGVVLLAGVLSSWSVRFATPMIRWLTLLKNPLRGLLLRDSLAAQAAMGALNGLLPCGLVYVAAAGATTTTHPLNGAAYMACFGLGTWPVMAGIHFASRHLTLPAGLKLGNVTRVAVLVMAVLLILRGLEMGIPFLSPDFSSASGGNSRCH